MLYVIVSKYRLYIFFIICWKQQVPKALKFVFNTSHLYIHVIAI